MKINWTLVVMLAALIALFVGAWLNRRLESRAALTTFFGHVAAFTVTPPGGVPTGVHTHAVVIRNASRRLVTNVRLHHNGPVPDGAIWPDIDHHRQVLPGGNEDIVIPSLPPGRELIVSYLYFPPLLYNLVNAGIDCDQGIVQHIPVLLQRQLPRWIRRTNLITQIIGIVALLYVAYRLAQYAATR
jgi:hypothetical protein